MAAEALLPWHQDLWARLWARHRAGRLPHALLCCGPAGLGKRRFAERFAQALLCQSPGGGGAPCGDCGRCRLFAAGSHPDYLRLEPAEAGKSIAVDQVRRLGEFLGLTSHFGGYKPALLAPADSLNRNAANALLKTLEEPPAAGVLLLVTDAPSRLPATVRSRCQRLAFAPPDPAAAVAWLAPQVAGHDPALLLALAGGSPLTALACGSDETLERRRALFASFAGVLSGRADPVQAAQPWMTGDLAEHLRWLIGWHMDMIRLKFSPQPPRLLNPDLRPGLQELATRMPAPALFRRLDAALRLRELCATQVNMALMVEAFFADCLGT